MGRFYPEGVLAVVLRLPGVVEAQDFLHFQVAAPRRLLELVLVLQDPSASTLKIRRILTTSTTMFALLVNDWRGFESKVLF